MSTTASNRRWPSLLRKTLWAAATVIVATFVTFVLVDQLPGDRLAYFFAPDEINRMTDERRAQLASQLGLDRPLIERYGRWAANALRGDFGRSIRTKRPVAEELASRLAATIELSLASIALVLAIGLPIGWWSARRRGTARDRAVTLGLVALYAVPTFWLAVMLQHFFSVELGWLPVFGRTAQDGTLDLPRRLSTLVLPSASLALHGLAYYAAFARDTALSGWTSAHARNARAAGVPESPLFAHHAIRPSLVALITWLGLLAPGLVAGSVVIETIFRWPGLGRLFVQAALERDLPVLMGMTSLIALLTVLGSLIADSASQLFDPRLREERRT